MKLKNLNEKTLAWSHDRGILDHGKPTTQVLKLMEEVGELAKSTNSGQDCRDDIGDCLVVLCNLSAMLGTSLEDCWEVAYNNIKDRKGYLNERGNFIKYDSQTRMDFDDKTK